MIQEIITYLIIGGAIALVVWPLLKLFTKKQPGEKSTPPGHNCGSCHADCTLRDQILSKKEEEATCHELQKESE